MDIVQYPVVLTEGSDVLMFASDAEVGQYCEPIDVGNCVYRSYDALGNRIELTVRDSVVHVARPEGEPQSGSSELMSTLTGFAEFVGETRIGLRPGESVTLSRMIEVLYPWCAPFAQPMPKRRRSRWYRGGFRGGHQR